MFVRIMEEAVRGIKPERRIRMLEPDGSPAKEVEPTIFWTWGEAV
jgi:hypothetical protein